MSPVKPSNQMNPTKLNKPVRTARTPARKHPASDATGASGTFGLRGAFVLATVLFILYSAYTNLGPGASSHKGGTPAGTVASPFTAEQLAELRPARVERIVDGDTIIVHLDGKRERVRYIGIDAPESVTPDQDPECFGKEASEANAQLVEGEEVLLEFDQELRDDYDRLLAYVYRKDGVFVNARLVEMGFAEAVYIRPNVKHADSLHALERRARSDRVGLWGSCRG